MQLSDIKDKVAVTFEFSWGFAEGRGIGWKTSIPLDVPPHELDAILDKLRQAIERQDFWYKLGSVEALIVQESERISKTIGNIKAIEERYEGQLERMTRDDKDTRKQLIGTLCSQNRDIETHQHQATELRARLNGQASG